MTFAIFYNRDDLEAISIQLNRGDLNIIDKEEAFSFWDGGFNRWDIDPRAKSDHLQGDSDTRETVVNANNFDLTEFRELLTRIGTNYTDLPGMIVGATEYMNAISDDLATSAVEPWSSN